MGFIWDSYGINIIFLYGVICAMVKLTMGCGNPRILAIHGHPILGIPVDHDHK
jgi:hypothetical protein